MPEHRKAIWRLIFLTYPCPTCGAAPGEDCITSNGNIYKDVHAARTRDGNRCPRCGTKIAWDMAGQLCGRCHLLRDLEVERATKYQRKDP